ncbi:MAG: UDP-N-acetylmuramoyl-tripeptide--D-alanyl-D-alanine ligase [Bacteroidota bacterium]
MPQSDSPISSLLATLHQGAQVHIDSRKVQSGDIFFALKGEHVDGNAYAGKALGFGAALAVIDNPAYDQADHDRLLLVEDSLKALQAFARARRQELNIPILGITGSNGKTTSKELIHSVLKTEKKVFATQGNFNNHIGVPLTLLAIPDDAEIAIVEMGTNQPGDISELVEMAQPTHGMITNIGAAHLEKLGSLEGVRKEKGTLFDHLRRSNGVVFLNESDPHLNIAARGVKRLITYGEQQSEWFANITKHGLDHMELQIHHAHWSEPQTFQAQLSGTYNATNILSAVVIGSFFGISLEGLKQGIHTYQSSNNRSQILHKGPYTIWLDAYNANISSMKAAIQHICEIGEEPVGLILGDMLEMGEAEQAIHKELGTFVQRFSPTVTIAIGPRMRFFAEKAPSPTHWYPSVVDASVQIAERLRGARLLLIKGSRGMALERLVELIG